MSKQVNSEFRTALAMALESADPRGELNKVAEVTSPYIRDKIREAAFVDKILPLETITKDQLERNENEEPVRYIELEPNAIAKTLNFRAKPDDTYLRTKRMAVPFYQISSQKVHKNEMELLTARSPVTQIVEEIMLKEMAKVKDEQFIDHVRAIIAYLVSIGEAADIGGVAGFGAEAISKAANRFVDAELALNKILINAKTFNSFIADSADSNKYGDIITEQLVKKGYIETSFMGYNYIVTNKTSLVGDNEMFGFTAPEWMGVNYVLQDPKFQIDKDMSMIEMVCWAYFGMGIANIRSVCRVHW